MTRLFAELAATCAERHFDFVDGVVFNRGESYITTGEFVDYAPYTSDYTYRKIYYQSIRQARARLSDNEGLHLALGHGLVLVLEGVSRAASGGARVGRAALVELADLSAHHAPITQAADKVEYRVRHSGR